MATDHPIDPTQKDTTTDRMEPIQPGNEGTGMELTHGVMESRDEVAGMEPMDTGMMTESTSPLPDHATHNSNR